MHYKGEGVSRLYTAWAALLAENVHWQLARHGKKTYHPDPGNTVKAALAGQISTGPWRCRSADVTSAVVIIAGLTALKTFYLQALVQPTAQKSPSNASDRDGWYMSVSRSLDASPLTCSNRVAERFRHL